MSQYKFNREILEQIRAEGRFVDLRTGEIMDEPPVYGRYPVKVIDLNLFQTLCDQYKVGKLYLNRYSEVLGLTQTVIRSLIKKCNAKLSMPDVRRIYKDDIRDQFELTCMKRYETDNPAQLEWVKRKREQTYEKRTGYKHPMQNPASKALQAKTMRERHGVENPSQLEWVKEKKAKTSLKNCGETSIFKTEEFKERLVELRKEKDPRYAKILGYKEILENSDPTTELITEIYTFLEGEYQYTQRYVLMHFLELFRHQFSRPEFAMKAILESIPVEFESHIRGYKDLRNKKGNLFELDFLISDGLAIEVNGLYTHSVCGPKVVGNYGNEFEADFHFHKFKECHVRGITLLSFTDIEIYEFPDFVRDVVRFHLGEIDEVGIPEGLIERLNFKDLDEIDRSRCYCLTPTKDLESIELRERVIDGFTYIDAGFQK